VKINGINLLVTFPTQVQILKTCDLMRGVEHINDEFRMPNGGMNVAEMVRAAVADHMLRLIPLGAGHPPSPRLRRDRQPRSGGVPIRTSFTKIHRDSQAFAEIHKVSQYFKKKL
jgi:hypothetical protein